MGIGFDFKGKLSILRLVAEGTPDGVEQAGEEHLFRIDGYGSRFNFREVENVADKVKEIRSGTMNGTGEFNLLVREVVLWILAELLAQHQDAVKGRTQLVRHVRQEF